MSFLSLLSITIPPIAAIYIVHTFLVGHKATRGRLPSFNHGALASWFIAISAQSEMLRERLVMSSAPALNTFLIAAMTYGLIAIISQRCVLRTHA